MKQLIRVIVIVISILIGVILGNFILPNQTSSLLPWNIEKQKRYISSLIEQGLYKQAAVEYEKLSYSNLPDNEKSNLLYLSGNIYVEQLNDYESALTTYLKSKIVSSNTKLLNDINTKIIECLEKLGRSYDAAKLMDQTVTLNKRAAKKGATVIAKIGNREITQQELEERIRSLAPDKQSEFMAKDKQSEFLKQYIAEELLYQSGKRKGYDRDQDLVKQMDFWRKQIIIQRVLNDELGNKTVPTEKEVDLYYKAHKDEFKDKDNKTKPFSDVKDEITAKIREEKVKAEQQLLFNRLIQAEKVEIYDTKIK